MCDCLIKVLSQNLGMLQQTYIELPNGKTVNIDRCLEKEIKYLLSKGVVTTGCCCGHNFLLPYIGVTKESIPLMKKLHYKVEYNPFDTINRTFWPKSVKIKWKYIIKYMFLRIIKYKIK